VHCFEKCVSDRKPLSIFGYLVEFLVFLKIEMFNRQNGIANSKSSTLNMQPCFLRT
jgi:hypothetical protein